ncbi:hypothetical protein ACWEQ3_48910 [Streptomyces mirabilis]
MALRLRLGPRQYVRQPDRQHPYLHDRKLVGWDPTMSEQETADAAAGWWRVGPKSERERYAVAVGEGVVRLVMAIKKWELDETDGRRAFHYAILRPGDPVHDRLIGRPDPVRTESRNPVAYFQDEADLGVCNCGCGTLVRGDWAVGHDLAALHRIVTHHFDGQILRFTNWCGEQGYPVPPPPSETAGGKPSASTRESAR